MSEKKQIIWNIILIVIIVIMINGVINQLKDIVYELQSINDVLYMKKDTR